MVKNKFLLIAVLFFSFTPGWAAQPYEAKNLWTEVQSEALDFDYDAPIRVRGVIKETGISRYATPYVALSDEADHASYVVCVLPRSDALKLKNFKKGQSVLMDGHFYAAYERVVLKKCKLAEENVSSGLVFAYPLGEYTFYALVNGTGTNGDRIVNLKDASAADKTPGWDQTAFSSFLLDTGAHKILFDAGHPESAGGKIADRLREIGVTPEEIDVISLTHMHTDHIGGLLNAAGEKRFPNAKVYLAQEEAAYWGSVDEAENPRFDLARQVLKVYADSLVLFPQQAEIAEGVTAVPLFGHTPGHSGFLIQKNGKKVLVWGDVLHTHIQFADPDLYLAYDLDPKSAADTRKKILKRVAGQKTGIAGMHVIAPGAGTVKKAKKGYQFVPGL